jgi:hypothetical protein
MIRIEKKTWPDLFQKVLDGSKSFDLRLGDFECAEGDVLVLREWDPGTQEYTGREIEKEITFIFNTKDISFWSEEDVNKYGYHIMSLK